MLSALQSMPTRGKAILGGSVLAGLVVMFLVFQLATAPSYVTVVSGLTPGSTGKVTQALDAAAIQYELQNNGTAVGVVAAKQAEAKVALATAGVDTSGAEKPGNELFDKQKLGASNFQQKVTYQRALEGEIGKSLMNINGISSATVQLSMPEDKLFADETRPPTASVLLTPPANGLDPSQVRGMAKLIAGAVEGLKDENVTITSTTGELLWPAGDGNGGAGGGSTMKLAAENRYAAQLEADVNAMLTRTIGADKAYVEARPTLNVDDVSRDELRYGPQRLAQTSKTDRERLQSNGGRGVPAGSRANIENAAAANGNGRSNYQRDSDEETFAIDKTVQRTKVAPGTVDKLDVALVLDQSLPKPIVSQVEAAVSSAVGLDPSRGDTLSVSQVPFSKPKADTQSGPPVAAEAIGIAKWIGLAIAAALFLFFITRALRRREGETLGDARWLTEIDEPRPLAALEAGVPERALPAVPPASPVRQQVGEMADREPERVANQLRAWMAEA